MALNRDDVVDAAWHILQSYGLGDLSMRRLAKELGVQPGALYWHVANKQELLAVLAQRMVAPLAVHHAVHDDAAPRAARPAGHDGAAPGLPGGRRTEPCDLDPARVAAEFRRLVLSVRDGAEVVGVAHALDPLDLPPVPVLVAALSATGLTQQAAEDTALTLVRFTLGSITAQQTREAMGLPTTNSAPRFEAGLALILGQETASHERSDP
ncbi:TetR family transcriptional regulator [Kocuria marina]|uniref:TetR family transcriptional regulator n=1 Tax=Kocuria marina TaxID=223184 RepID=UPI003F24F09E